MNVAQAQQGAHIGFVGLRGKWVSEENNCHHLFLGHPRPNLLVAAQWPRQVASHAESRFTLEDAACGSGGNQVKAPQGFPVLERKQGQVQLLFVVSNERNGFSHLTDTVHRSGTASWLQARVGRVKVHTACFEDEGKL